MSESIKDILKSHIENMDINIERLKLEKRIIQEIIDNKFILSQNTITKIDFKTIGKSIINGDCFSVAKDVILNYPNAMVVIGLAENVTHLMCFHAWNKLENRYVDLTWQTVIGIGLKYYKLIELNKDEYFDLLKYAQIKQLITKKEYNMLDFYQILIEKYQNRLKTY